MAWRVCNKTVLNYAETSRKSQRKRLPGEGRIYCMLRCPSGHPDTANYPNCIVIPMPQDKVTQEPTNGSTASGSDSDVSEDTAVNEAASADDRLPPLPADYEMPDDFRAGLVDDALDWAKNHPFLALAAVAGTGLIAGRLIAALIPEEEEPPTLGKRIASHTRDLRSDAGEVGSLLGKRLVEAADALKEAAAHTADRSHELAEEGTEKARDLADLASEATRAAVAEVVSKKADSWAKKLRKKYGYKRFG